MKCNRMKKPIAAILLLIFNLFFITAKAQIKLAPIQVKEILVRNTVAGLGGSTSADVKVVAEAGKWNSYLTHKTSYSRMPGRQSYDSVSQKFIAVVSPILLNNMLTGIAAVKPAITSSTFNLTPNKLIAELKNGAKLPVSNSPDFEKLITQKDINDAIAKNIVDIGAMDVYVYCEVDIVTRKNDTVKLKTRNFYPTKLPWMINNQATYDMAINNFVVAAIGNEDVPNKEALNISSLKESIYKYIDERNASAPIASFKWQYDYPENLKLLTENFTISKKFLYGNVYSCLLRTNTMPANASLECQIDMTRKSDVKMVIEYAALIDKYFKTNNFMFNYYRNLKDAYIGFAYYTGRSPYYSLEYLGKKLPELAKTDSTQVIHCWISAPDDASTWIMFPDNKALLTYHSVTTPNGETAPIYPPLDPNANWSIKSNTYYLFDGSGKVLSQGRGF